MQNNNLPDLADIQNLPGWQRLALGDVGSTNSIGLEQARSGADQIWITAKTQSTGRGRRGRHWVSEEGNLYASLVLQCQPDWSLISTLPLVAGLAIHDAVLTCAPQLADQLKIKWPNDLLLDGSKCSGLLLEGASLPGNSQAVVIGCGVNLVRAPENGLYPITSLANHGVNCLVDDLFHALAVSFAARLTTWNGGKGFHEIRDYWLARASGLGESIIVRNGPEELHGRFLDLDMEGRLVLGQKHGQTSVISAGDIFLSEQGMKGA